MGTFIKADRYQRLIISILFRLILTVYSIILFSHKTPEYQLYVNIVIFIGYWVIFLLLWGRNGWYSLARIIIDFIFIFLVLIQLHTFTFIEYSLLFLPILNCQNHTSNKRTILVYILPLSIIYFIHNKIELFYILPFITFWLINLFESFRTKYLKFIENLNSQIDNLYLNNNSQIKPYSIYKESIPIFNDSNLLHFKIEEIICFKVFEDKYRIINGSFFTWEFDIKESNKYLDIIKQIKDSGYIFNLPLVINKQKFDRNLVLIYLIKNEYYCFSIIPQKTNYAFNLELPFFIPKLVQPFFHRLSKVLETDAYQKKLKYEEIQKISEKYYYITKAEKAIHHINNHLTPFKNLSALVKKYQSTYNEEEKKRIIKLMEKDSKNIQSSLQDILDRVDLILNKPMNPFNVTALEKVGIQILYARVKNIWDYHFEVEKFNVNWITTKDRKKADVCVNIDGIDLIISNWLSNVNKYNTGTYGINFNENDDLYIIDFYNSFNDEKVISNMLELFNAVDKMQVFRATSHGIFHIKECLEQMCILADLYIADNLLHFKINLKKYYLDENSSL